MTSRTPETNQNTTETQEDLTRQTQRSLQRLEASVPDAIKQERDVNVVKNYVNTEIEKLGIQVQRVKDLEKRSQKGVNTWEKKLQEAEEVLKVVEERVKRSRTMMIMGNPVFEEAQKAREAVEQAKKNLEKSNMNKSEFSAASRNLQQRVEATRIRIGMADSAKNSGDEALALQRAQQAAEFVTVSANTVDETMRRAQDKGSMHENNQLTDAELKSMQENERATLDRGKEYLKMLDETSILLGAASYEFRTGKTPQITTETGITYKITSDGEVMTMEGARVEKDSEAYHNILKEYAKRSKENKEMSNTLQRSWTITTRNLNVRPEDAEMVAKYIRDAASPFVNTEKTSDFMREYTNKTDEAKARATRIPTPVPQESEDTDAS